MHIHFLWPFDKDKISTIEKSNVDWETYKEKTNLNNEEFEKKAAQGDGSYLNKKEFLQRVDVRRFEHEKDERDRKRVANSWFWLWCCCRIFLF